MKHADQLMQGGHEGFYRSLPNHLFLLGPLRSPLPSPRYGTDTSDIIYVYGGIVLATAGHEAVVPKARTSGQPRRICMEQQKPLLCFVVVPDKDSVPREQSHADHLGEAPIFRMFTWHRNP